MCSYTLETELEQDFDGTLRKVAQIGFERVELAGFLGRAAIELRVAFDRARAQVHQRSYSGRGLQA